MSSFGAELISDNKRLARGEHLLMARNVLRARDGVHNRPWRVLMMSGDSPAGNIAALRSLMPKCHITAVDKDMRCLDSAIECGVDEVVHCDVTELANETPTRVRPNPQLTDLDTFDLVDLDLCGLVTKQSMVALNANFRLVKPGGVLMFTFAYGRDVVEVFEYGNYHGGQFTAIGASPSLAKRLAFVSAKCNHGHKLRSVIAYRGAEMPMCAMLFDKGSSFCATKTSFIQVGRGDFELAVVYPDAARLYDCPQERIESLRRQFAAIKASITTKARRSALKPNVPLPGMTA
jgi:SAM-dependent methyltransferase